MTWATHPCSWVLWLNWGSMLERCDPIVLLFDALSAVMQYNQLEIWKVSRIFFKRQARFTPVWGPSISFKARDTPHIFQSAEIQWAVTPNEEEFVGEVHPSQVILMWLTFDRWWINLARVKQNLAKIPANMQVFFERNETEAGLTISNWSLNSGELTTEMGSSLLTTNIMMASLRLFRVRGLIWESLEDRLIKMYEVKRIER